MARRLASFSCLLSLLWITASSAFVEGDLFASWSLRPGQWVRGKITLVNEGGVPEAFHIHQVDYASTAAGEHHFLEAGTTPRSNASWIELGASRLTLPPHSKRDLFYTVRVPLAPLVGSYWSVLLIEPDSFIGEGEVLLGDIGIRVKVRYAYHIHTAIGEGRGVLKIAARRPLLRNGERLLAYDVVNVGECYLRPKATLRLYDERGAEVAVFALPPQRLYPGNGVCFASPLPKLDEQRRYTAFLLLDAGGKQLYGDRSEWEGGHLYPCH